VGIPAPLARTTRRFTLDSDRQITRLTRATDALGGDIRNCSASDLLRCCDTADVGIQLPREMVLELTTRRATKPIFAASTHLKIERADFSLKMAQKLFDELGQADDMRLVLAGVGDPLLHPAVFEIIDIAHGAGISGISIETDFVGIESGTIQKLVSSGVDVVSVCLPGASAKTYLAMMGVDAVKTAVDHLREFIQLRQAQGRCTPILTPTFVKSAMNLADMEPWYDHWLRTVGCAVIVSPNDFAGQIPETAAVRMEPPQRRTCARLAKRLTVLCDGTVVSCEQDVLGKQVLGHIGENSIGQIWTGAAAKFQKDHQLGRWDLHELCTGCRDWHRP
jgi:radical SAM protein with 4Fe4S-binding SPASM domain